MNTFCRSLPLRQDPLEDPLEDSLEDPLGDPPGGFLGLLRVPGDSWGFLGEGPWKCLEGFT